MLSVKDLSVYRVRLKNTSLAEIIYRSKELFLIWRLKNKFICYNHKTPKLSNLSYNKNLVVPSFQGRKSAGDIADLLSGKNFALNDDPDVSNQIEKQIGGLFFATIDWRNQDFDIRTIWEPARLQNITVLIAYKNANPFNSISDKIKQYCSDKILYWIKKNRFPFGPHYISVMECALRIPVFFYSLIFLKGLKSHQTRPILEAIYVHAWWISKRLSLFSSRGNHTIAESVGLIFAGAIFYDRKEAKKWFYKGICTLEKELAHQILEDGGPAEQSLHYHRFILDLYWLAIDFLEKNNLYECSKLKSRLIRAEEFLSAFKTQNGHLPSIGDSDDGFAVAPGIEPKKPIVHCPKKKKRIFKHSGYTIINTANGAQLIFDHGPLGLPPLYNHGHADALSVILGINGKQILVDCGTYKYNGTPEWRRYFKGTKAHNTVLIDGRDQSVQETEFIWSYPYNAELLGFLENADQFLVNAMHTGYERLREPVRHKRDILYFDDCCFLIRDSFKGNGVHEFEINFHLHPNVSLLKTDNWWQIDNEDAKIYMRLLENEDFLTIRGSKDPIHGWYSPCYGTKVKCTVMNCSKKGFPHEISFVTAICTGALVATEKFQDRLICFD